MVEGAFIKKISFFNILCLCGGAFLIGLFIFSRFVEHRKHFGMSVLFVIGLIAIVSSLFSLFLNFKAFLTFDGAHLKGKYHWFGKIDCDISEIDFAIHQTNSITIQLKNGNRHTIMGLNNPIEVCDAIRKKLHFERKHSVDELLAQINRAKKGRKNIFYVWGGMSAIAFLMIFAAVFFTDGKDLSEFATKDWIILAICGSCVFLAFFMVLFYGSKSAKNTPPIPHLEYVLRRTVVETQRLPIAKIKGIYTESDYYGRIVVFENPNGSIHYVVQEFLPDWTLKTIFKSDEYENEEAFLEAVGKTLEQMIDITQLLYY